MSGSDLDGKFALDLEAVRVKRYNSNLLGFTAIFALGIIAFGLIMGIKLITDKNQRIAAAQASAKSKVGIKYKVVSGWNEKTGNLYSVALENPGTRTQETFEPCTSVQKSLKEGDEVEFEYNEKVWKGGNGYNPYCYLPVKAEKN